MSVVPAPPVVNFFKKFWAGFKNPNKVPGGVEPEGSEGRLQGRF